MMIWSCARMPNSYSKGQLKADLFCTACRILTYIVLSESSKGEFMRMEQNSRGSCNADFEQFSRFLRGNQQPRRTTPCNSNNSGASVQNPQRTDKSLAMVYAVKQNWQGIYDPEIALVNGTIFEELNKPFYPSGCNSNNGCRGKNNGGGCAR